MSYDGAAWGALALALSTLLGIVTFFRWRRHGPAAGLNGAGWTILPVAAWLTGVLELVFDVAASVGTWAVRLVFSPVVWLGIVLTATAAVLFGASAMLRGRGRGPGHPLRRPPGRKDASAAVGPNQAHGEAAIGDGDLDDIEAILRRHGIS